MSMQHHAGFICKITEKEILKLNLKSFLVFREFLLEHNLELDEVGNDLENDEKFCGFLELPDEEYQDLKQRYKQFRADFEEATGMGISIAYFSDVEGDIQDGAHWAVDALMFRPEAEKLGITWENVKLFTLFG